MKVGMVLPMSAEDAGGVAEWPRIRELARHADDAGIDSLWVSDHLVMRDDGVAEAGIREGWTTLSAIAAVTERAELGTLVTATPFRSPALLAKMAASVDDVSDGRLNLGLGCGWHEPEFAAFGYSFDHLVSRFEEALMVIGPLVRGERVTLHGRWIDVDGAVLLPPPPRPGRIPGRLPIMVAAVGERMLRLAARYADGWNTNGYGLPSDLFAARRDAFHRACNAEQRDPSSIEVSVGAEVAMSAVSRARSIALPPDGDALAAALDAWAAEGVSHVQLNLLPASRAAIDLVRGAIRRHRGQ